ncbi:hypothetical protein GF318_03730 [Candidatus Micrarchaeota archaeon]|nr:hypothetical protein [Candidatus Micrarchaeota archaeon]
MHHIKRLAFADRKDKVKKPQRKKNLVFRALAPAVFALASFSSCSTANAHLRMENNLPNVTERYDRHKNTCRFDSGGLLQRGERIIDTECRENDILVLTNNSLYIVYTSSPEQNMDGVVFSLRNTRIDLQHIMSGSFVDWSSSGDAVHILTENSRLYVISLDGHSDTIPTYSLSFDAGEAQMAHHDNTLFIAPASGNILMLNFSQGIRERWIVLSSSYENPQFISSGENLYFGEIDGKRVELTGNGVRE